MGTFSLPGPHLIWPVLQPLTDDSAENISSLAIYSSSLLSGCYSQCWLHDSVYSCVPEDHRLVQGRPCVNRNFRFPTPGKWQSSETCSSGGVIWKSATLAAAGGRTSIILRMGMRPPHPRFSNSTLTLSHSNTG